MTRRIKLVVNPLKLRFESRSGQKSSERPHTQSPSTAIRDSCGPCHECPTESQVRLWRAWASRACMAGAVAECVVTPPARSLIELLAAELAAELLQTPQSDGSVSNGDQVADSNASRATRVPDLCDPVREMPLRDFSWKPYGPARSD